VNAIPDRWNIDNLKALGKNPQLLERETRMWLSQITHPVHNHRYRTKYADGIDVIEREWDNLFILDACRFDYMKEQRLINGELRPAISQASTSYEFIKQNFLGRDLHDTIYITANPYVEELSKDVFYTVENLLIDQWDDDLGTVPPEAVVDATLKAHEAHPDKKLIVHFMQPHQPPLGPTAERINERLNLNNGYNKYQCVDGTDTKLSGTSWFGAVMQGEISHAELRQAYTETLDLVLDSTEQLLSAMDGKSVVTADHGEFLGERLSTVGHRLYGHKPDNYAPELRVVPWLEVESDSRRDVVSETPIGFERLEDDSVDDRLRALGYVPE